MNTSDDLGFASGRPKEEYDKEKSYEQAITAAVNYVTNQKFRLESKDKKPKVCPNFGIVFYHSKDLKDSERNRLIVGLGKQGSEDYFLRIDWEDAPREGDPPKKLHFNAVYIGGDTDIPTDIHRHTCAVVVDKASKKAFNNWVADIQKISTPEELWRIWSSGHRPAPIGGIVDEFDGDEDDG
ncbi:hypothetical protein FRC12_024699 [Ceratobasidium sp. 428]|nr:hypothetical protein FRC12_024699 [Ceratobasidium sp. 428]